MIKRGTKRKRGLFYKEGKRKRGLIDY